METGLDCTVAAMSLFGRWDLVAPRGFCKAPWGHMESLPPSLPRSLPLAWPHCLMDFSKTWCGGGSAQSSGRSIKDHIFLDYHLCAKVEVGTLEIAMNKSILMH